MVGGRRLACQCYHKHSKDYGRTWQENDIPLEEPGRFNTDHYPFTDSMVKTKDRYYVLAYRFRGDIVQKEADLLLLNFI